MSASLHVVAARLRSKAVILGVVVKELVVRAWDHEQDAKLGRDGEGVGEKDLALLSEASKLIRSMRASVRRQCVEPRPLQGLRLCDDKGRRGGGEGGGEGDGGGGPSFIGRTGGGSVTRPSPGTPSGGTP